MQKGLAMKSSENAPPVTYTAAISTLNEDNSPLLSQIVPALIRGLRATLTLPRHSKTAENLARTGECVINLPGAEGISAFDHLAQAASVIDTIRNPNVSKFGVGGRLEAARITLVPSEVVSVGRALECPMQLEAKVIGDIDSMTWERFSPWDASFELEVLRVHLDSSIVLREDQPNMWKPLMDCLREAYRTQSATS
jgi:flavin reductase (DIM6/NTAB) family NADH-FMN oxidoreductase RutF